jgi:hypothetical protein
MEMTQQPPEPTIHGNTHRFFALGQGLKKVEMPVYSHRLHALVPRLHTAWAFRFRSVFKVFYDAATSPMEKHSGVTSWVYSC